MSRQRLISGLQGKWLRTVALSAAMAAMPGAAISQQLSYAGTNVTGSVALAGVVNLRSQAQVSTFQALRAAPPEVVRPQPPRLVPPGVGMNGAPLMTSMAAASPSLSVAASPVAPVTALAVAPAAGLSGFNALSHRDQRLAYNGNQFSVEPPNASLAVGNGYTVEGVNNAVQIYSTAGAPLLPVVVASNQVFGLAPALNRSTGVYGVYLTDMRVYYDQNISRWIIIQRSQDEDTSGTYLRSSHLYIAVSQTADPTANYNIYIMDTTNWGHPGCPCIADYPQVGSDQYGLHIAWNEFSYLPSSAYYSFVDASVLVLSKTALAAGSPAPTAVQFLLPPFTGFEFSLQPATTPPGASNFLASGGMEFFVSTALGSTNRVALWAMYNTISLTTSSPVPILLQTTIPTLYYALPGSAGQPPGPTPYGTSLGRPLETLDGGDTRVQSLSYASGRLYLTLQSSVIDDSTHQSVVGAVYIVLSPTYRTGVLAGQVLNQGYLFVRGNHLLRPALAVNAKGAGAIGVTISGRDWYPTAAVIPFQSLSTPSSIQVAALGALPEDGFSGYPSGGGFGVARWGDFNTAVAASDGSIWMVVQYIGAYPRTDLANWNTYIFRKQP